MDMRRTVDGIVWRFRTGVPWRDVPVRFGNWNSIYGRFADWSRDGTLASVLAAAQAAGQRVGDVDWTVSMDATITPVHQHGATLTRTTGGTTELQQTR